MLFTSRLLIRPARISDAHDLFAVYGDAQTMRYWSSGPDESLDDTHARIDEMANAVPQTYFVFEYNGQAIGTGGVHEQSEIGFILNRAFWRKGFVTEAMQALMPWLYDTLDKAALTADVDPRNLASCECLLSLGFTETGRAENTFCVNGEWSDSVYFARQRPS